MPFLTIRSFSSIGYLYKQILTVCLLFDKFRLLSVSAGNIYHRNGNWKCFLSQILSLPIYQWIWKIVWNTSEISLNWFEDEEDVRISMIIDVCLILRKNKKRLRGYKLFFERLKKETKNYFQFVLKTCLTFTVWSH